MAAPSTTDNLRPAHAQSLTNISVVHSFISYQSRYTLSPCFAIMSVRVVARIRPLLKNELDKDVIVQAASSGVESDACPTVVKLPNPKNDAELFSYHFNSVYDQSITQQELFEKEGTVNLTAIVYFKHSYDDSLPHCEASLQWLRRDDIRIWRHWNWKDSYDARWKVFG
jgi:hypothetical protein